jgi:hypothetical protein
MGATDPFVTSLTDGLARWAGEAAAAAILYLFHYISQPTDPVFATLTPVYNRILAMSLLIVGAVVAFALLERVLGGRRGAGAEVVLRTLLACGASMVGLALIRYAVNLSDLIATVWNSDVYLGANRLVGALTPARSPGQAFGSALGLMLTAILTVFLAILVHIELILRAALLTLTTAFLPLACIAAIWPRLVGVVAHMLGFLVALLLSKFVMATAIYIGFAMVVQASMQSGDPTGALVTGVGTLIAAALSPLILFQGIRFAEASAGHAVRGFTLGAGRTFANLATSAGLRMKARAGGGAGHPRSSRSARPSVSVQPVATTPEDEK